MPPIIFIYGILLLIGGAFMVVAWPSLTEKKK